MVSVWNTLPPEIQLSPKGGAIIAPFFDFKLRTDTSDKHMHMQSYPGYPAPGYPGTSIIRDLGLEWYAVLGVYSTMPMYRTCMHA